MAEDQVLMYADKYLFAEDLVNYVFRNNCQYQILSDGDYQREFVYNGFNDLAKTAVKFLENIIRRVVDCDMIRLRHEDNVNREGYMKCAKIIQEICFPQGFDTEQFLYYCVHMACLAEHFFESGIVDAPVWAVFSIVDAIYNYDMFPGGWEPLNIVAQKFASIAADVEDLSTPPPTPELSDNEDFIGEES